MAKPVESTSSFAMRGKVCAAILILAGFSGHLAFGQSAQDTDDTEVKDTAKDIGGYKVHESVEFGGQVVGFSGSPSLWGTFVNLTTGPRVFAADLDMHSEAHVGMLFDDLSGSSLGYGGDPSSATQFKLSKARWYNFSGQFRRDRNLWDYDLFANPLNPANSNPSVPILFSPHRFDVTRRMQDYSLTLRPLSPFSVRLGYARNVSEGPALTTLRGGADSIIRQNWRTGLDTYQAGVDLKLLPRTNISFDQFVNHFKDDTNFNDPFLLASLSNGTPVDLGMIFDTRGNRPCGTPFLASGFVNPTCNAQTAYSHTRPLRTTNLTEQLALESDYFKSVNLSARVAYSSGSSDIDALSEFFQGFESGPRRVQFQDLGASTVNRISVTSDFGLTAHITPKLRFLESFRWNAFRLPGLNTLTESSLFAASLLAPIPPSVFNPAACPPPFKAATCPQHNANSGADLVSNQSIRFLGEDSKVNTAGLEYDFSKYVGASAGYRYRNRDIVQRSQDLVVSTFFPTLPNRGDCAGKPLAPNGTCTVTSFSTLGMPLQPALDTRINEHSLLAGFWLKPMEALRFNFDGQLTYADNAFTRISPRHLQQYRVRTRYTPVKWITAGMSFRIVENRDNQPDVDNLQHNRSYDFVVLLTPNEKLSFDASYSFNDIFSQTGICYVFTPAPAGAQQCATAPAPFLQATSLYSSSSHFGAVNAMFKPLPRVTTALGLMITSTNSNSLLVNPIIPPGTLDSIYVLPTATLAVDLNKEWTWKGGWNYYGYGERLGDFGPTLPRNFHGNVVTLALRYGF